MGWMIIRRATNEDEKALHEAAMKFAAKYCHSLKPSDIEGVGAVWALEAIIEPDDPDERRVWARERKLWKAQVKRTLGAKDAEGIAYGYVGYHVE